MAKPPKDSIHQNHVNLSTVKNLFLLIALIASSIATKASDTTLVKVKTLRGGLSPKSVVYSGNGLFFVQNMMYNHTISVYDENFRLRKTISDRVKLQEYGLSDKEGYHRGAPVECAFSPDGKYAYVSNYCMEGEGFENPGCDTCCGKQYDISYIYKINTQNLQIESVIPAGSVPKYLAVSPNQKYLLVSNWSSGDVTLIDLEKEKEIKRFYTGRFPRGLAVDSKSKYAYIAVMGGTSIRRIDLENLSSEHFVEVGRAPRHVCIDTKDSFLYVTLNHEGNLARINLHTKKITKLKVGGTPRSMVIGNEDRFLYIVNYSAAQMTKVDLKSFQVKETIETGKSPIGITYDQKHNRIWVACYSGSIMVYSDKEAPAAIRGNQLEDYLAIGPMISDMFYSFTDIFPKSNTRVPLLENPVNIPPATTPPAEKTKPIEKAKPIEKVEKPKVSTAKIPDKKILPATQTDGTYFVIVGSFKNADNAVRKTQSMKAKGYTCEVIDNGNGFHYAAVGGYVNKEDASTAMNLLKEAMIEGWVWKKP
jgi:YVTN family beta-propeller protein